MSETRYFRVRGRVQGVGFRAATREAARNLWLAGWVRNCPNGDVELTAQGEAAALDHLRDWLHAGPPMARVCEVLEQTAEPTELRSSFEVK